MQNLSKEECIAAYVHNPVSAYRDVDLTVRGNTDFLGYEQNALPPTFNWMCSAIPGHSSTYGISGLDTACTAADLDSATWAYTSFTGLSQTAVEPGGSVTWPIQYCMAEPIEEYYIVRFSLTNLGLSSEQTP
jgi:hypothetical protein